MNRKITMNDALGIASACLAGGLLGGFFFAGLWWTVRKGVASRRPALWFFCSLMLRVGAAAAVFYLVGGGRWERLLACLAGFVAVRWFITSRVREASHAP